MKNKAEIKCRQCGGIMRKTNKKEHNYIIQILGIVVFILGLCLLFIFPLGTIAGLCLMIVSARMGFKKRKIWLCDSCGYFFEMA